MQTGSSHRMEHGESVRGSQTREGEGGTPRRQNYNLLIDANHLVMKASLNPELTN